MNFQKIYFSVLNGVWPGNDVMHLGAPKEKKKVMTSFSVDVLGLTVPDGSNCRLLLIIPHAN